MRHLRLEGGSAGILHAVGAPALGARCVRTWYRLSQKEKAL